MEVPFLRIPFELFQDLCRRLDRINPPIARHPDARFREFSLNGWQYPLPLLGAFKLVLGVPADKDFLRTQVDDRRSLVLPFRVADGHRLAGPGVEPGHAAVASAEVDAQKRWRTHGDNPHERSIKPAPATPCSVACPAMPSRSPGWPASARPIRPGACGVARPWPGVARR